MDGAAGRHRLAGREPDPATIAALASWCAARGLLLAELRTTGGTLEERFLELIAEPAADETGGGTGDSEAGADGTNADGTNAEDPLDEQEGPPGEREEPRGAETGAGAT